MPIEHTMENTTFFCLAFVQVCMLLYKDSCKSQKRLWMFLGNKKHSRAFLSSNKHPWAFLSSNKHPWAFLSCNKNPGRKKYTQPPDWHVQEVELLMRLFLQHVLNVRPETLDCRRNTVRRACREWCSDGVAASSTGAGMLGPVLAFRGEIEAQGRGSLHPQNIWLVCGHLEVLSQLTDMLRNKQDELRQRLKEFMQLAVASFESISHASVQAAPRCLGSDVLDAPVKVTEVARDLFRGDGGSDKELLVELKEKTPEQEEYLQWISEEDWRRPRLEVEAHATGKQSIFATPINHLSVATTPQYRLRSLLCDPNVPELDADAWRMAFQQDLHSLMPSLLRHFCTESCYKYSDSTSKTFQICRHGFYHVIHICDGCRVRRKGKYLRPSVYIVGEDERDHGMEGRLRPIQLSPFECQTCYGGTVSGRHNLDLQDMRRVVSPYLWLDPEDQLPYVGSVDFLGYMASWEWTGCQYETRPKMAAEPVSWIGRRKELADSFRSGWQSAYRSKFSSEEKMQCEEPDEAGNDEPGLAEVDVTTESHRRNRSGPEHLALCGNHDVEVSQAISLSVNEAFCDGINTGFYVNNYTTKPGPGLKMLMDELQTGIQRLENENKEREEKRKAEREAAEAAGEHLPGRPNKIFADTLRTLMRLTASYRRCHWKNAAEIIFPLLYQHLTFASHRTWKLYVKKAVFFAVEAWRVQYGDSVLQ